MSSTNSPSEKIICANPLCETALPNKAIRCPRCKESQRYCTNCQSSVRVLSRFCRSCGTVLRTDWSIEHPGLRMRPARNVNVEAKSVFRIDWELALDQEMTASPLIARGIVVLSLNPGHIVILDETDGQVKKELSTASTISFTPIISDNLLIVATGDSIIAFDLISALYGNVARSGLKVWQYNLNQGEQIIRPLLATVDQVIAIVKSPGDVKVVMLDKKTGEQRASLILDKRSGKVTTPFLRGKELIIGVKEGTVIVVDITQPKIIFMGSIGRSIDTNITPSLLGNNLLFVLGDGKIWSLQLNELVGGKINLQPFGESGGLLINCLATSDKYLAVGHGFGLVLYDMYGKQLWETQLDGNSIASPPLIVGDWAWVIDDSGVMFFFQLNSSVPKLRLRVFEYAASLPTILTGDRLIFTNRRGQIKVYCW